MSNSLPTPGGSPNTWGTQINNYLLVSHNADGTLIDPGVTWLNVTSEAFGADPTGVVDSTAAIQAAINQATGALAPATNTRTATAVVYLPSGTYKVSSDLIIRSVESFRLIGDGPGTTTLIASGTGFTQAVLFVDGSADGIYGGFAIQGSGSEAAGAGVLPDGIRLDFTTAAARSTTGNKFYDIRVRALKASVLMSLEGNGSKQLDGTVMENIVVSGGQTPGSWSNSGPWQVGFSLGDGTYANNYDHVQTGCSAALCYTGWKVNASSLALFGSQPAGNYQDFWVQAGAQCTFENIQSQDAFTFLTSPNQFTALPVSFRDVSVVPYYPATSPYLMISLNGGVWHFANFSMVAVINNVPAYVGGTISIVGTTSGRPCIATFENLMVDGTKAATFATLTNARVSVVNFVNFNPATGNYTALAAGDVLSSYAGGSWTNTV